MKNRSYTLLIWRQSNPNAKGKMIKYKIDNISPNISFLEMLDILNENLIKKGEEPIAYDSDCREGICGCCGLVINGVPHGHKFRTTTCQLYMRDFPEDKVITVEPFRAKGIKVIKDLIVDRSALDRIISKGGYISVNVGNDPDANSILIKKELADKSLEAASCIGCGACIAACPNGAATLFVGAKISQYSLLPQGDPERDIRVKEMIKQMDLEGFGNCSNHGECEAVCPQGISLENIARMRREFIKYSLI